MENLGQSPHQSIGEVESKGRCLEFPGVDCLYLQGPWLGQAREKDHKGLHTSLDVVQVQPPTN